MFQIPNDFFSDLIVQAVGAFIGVLGAVLIFRNQIKGEKKKKVAEDESFKKDKLKYLYILVRNILSISIQHQTSFIALSENFRGAPFQMHLLPTTAIYEFKRLTERLNVEDYFLSYVSLMKDDSESAKTFSELINQCETAAFTIEEAIRFHKDRMKTVYDLKVEFKKLYRSAAAEINNSLLLSEYKNDTPLIAKWQQCLAEKAANPKAIDTVFWTYKKLVEPMLIIIRTDARYQYGSLAPAFHFLHLCAEKFTEIDSYGPVTGETFSEFSTSMKSLSNSIIKNLNSLDIYLRKNDLQYKELPSEIL